VACALQPDRAGYSNYTGTRHQDILLFHMSKPTLFLA
jgi:hypothetical protein